MDSDCAMTDTPVRTTDRVELGHRLITNSNSSSDGSDSLFEGTSVYPDEESVNDKGDFTAGDPGSEERCLVLHPVESAYAMRYPDFNPFAGRQLIDNGYVDHTNNECKAMIVRPDVGLGSEFIPIDYTTTLFTVRTNDMEE